jgi:hypothetical protein
MTSNKYGIINITEDINEVYAVVGSVKDVILSGIFNSVIICSFPGGGREKE